MAASTSSRSAIEDYPMQEFLESEPTQHENQPEQHALGVPSSMVVMMENEERVKRLDSLQGIDRPQEEERRRHPRRRFRMISKALPFLLSSLTIYIYYIYSVRVCINYLIDVKGSVLQASSPSKPPGKQQAQPVPPTTTPYQQSSLSISSRPATEQINSVQSSSLPQTSSLSRSITLPAATASHSSNGQHTGPQLGSIVTTPKYPTATVAPVSQNMLGYSFPSQNDTYAASHISINISSDGSVQENSDNGHGHTGSLDAPSGVGAGQVSIDVQGPVSESRNTADERGPRLPIATLSVSKRDGRPRWCDVCKVNKPDRCHHCSECNRCVLRMDHHCPWVNGCIGYGNYKYFYLFIFYGSLAALWVVATMFPILMHVLREYDESYSSGNTTVSVGSSTSSTYSIGGLSSSIIGSLDPDDVVGDDLLKAFDVQWVIVTVIALLMALLIVSFTGAHTSYILRNRTTIEALQNVRSMFIRVQYRKMDPATDGGSNSSSNNNISNSSNIGGDLQSQSAPGAGVLHAFLSEIEFNVVMVEQGDNLWNRVPYHNAEGDGIHEVYNEKVYNRLVTDALAQARMQLVTIGLHETSAGSGPNNGPTESVATIPSSPRLEFETSNRDSFSESSFMGSQPKTSNVDRILADANRRLKSAQGSESNMPPSARQQASRKTTGASASSSSSGPSQSIRFESAPNSPLGDNNYSEGIIGTRPRKTSGQRHEFPFDGSSGYSTPRQFSSRNPNSSRQNSPKSQSASSRRRQRTMSGGTSGSSALGGGPIREFGMGLGMDGVAVDSGTGLKLSSSRKGRSNQSPGRGHPR
ncbi:hypothetical protein BGZ49_000942 [Haplosporangium sp. Z 27]|nr:hypothetical protein BGZ49_000942 [Haplosporangium sp. Z 27]